MRSVLVVVLNTNRGGGITTSVMNFVSELCQRGHQVTFLDFTAKQRNDSLHPLAEQIYLTGISKYYLLNPKDVANAPVWKKPFLAVLGLVKNSPIKTACGRN